MAEEFDVFASVNKGDNQKSEAQGNKHWTPSPKPNAGKTKKVHRQLPRAKVNNSPLRGANGEESVNPLLNAPLPTAENPTQEAEEASTNSNRDESLPEYHLSDIQTWPAPKIVERMMPGADPEELGTYRKHELIFAAIRQYLSKGGGVIASGCLEIVREGHGFLRSAKNNFLACPEDVFVTLQQIRRHALRTGDIIEGPVRDPRDRDRFFCLGNVNRVNGKEPSVAARVVHFENLTATFPTRRIILETDAKELSTRIIDIFTPIGFGQRGLIIAPPRVGKTVLLQKMANAISANHPDAMLIILLIDERPEEVTDMQRNTKAMVLSSTFDEEPQHHVNVTEMVLEMSKRQVENGRDVIILMDSITRMARAYNTVQPHSGKILTGGVDALAMHRPKRFFGAARNIEGGGSLTIIATGLVDTGSRMDEVIFEEFKGTGNMEIVLDRSLADKRIYPAIDIEKSGTRKEDLLLDPVELEKTWGLRRFLAPAGSEAAMKSVLNSLRKTQSNPEFLLALDLKNI
jgi:transcription termination factor Rho